MMKMKNEQLRPLYSVLLLFLGTPFLAMLVAPWVYRWLQHFAAEGSVLDAPFHRVTSRLALIVALALMPTVCRLSGFKTKADCGLTACANRRRLFWLGIGLGLGSMLMGYLPGVLLGVYAWDTGGKSGAYLFRKVVQILAGGFFVSVFEEVLFRGLIFGALRKSLGVIAAILISSFLFSIVHFMRPVDPAVTEAWYSGYLLFGNLFARAGDTFLQEACTLFCMGVGLSVLCQWTKSLYIAIGLHAGWVWVMMFFRLFTENQKTMIWLYGTGEWASKAWMGSLLAVTFLTAVLLTRKKWETPEAVPVEVPEF
jgi:membrane protease YdiL (CAAX protease family)